MHIGLNVHRLSNLKHYAGLVEHALAQGTSVTLFCDHTDTYTRRDGPKSYEFADVARIPPFRNGRPCVTTYRSLEDLADQLRRSRVNVFFSLYRLPMLVALKREHLPGLAFAEIQHGWDSLIHGADPDVFDVVYAFSAGWAKWWADYGVHEGRLQPEDYARALKQMESVLVPVGFAEMEQLRYIDPEAARARLGLPQGKRVVAFLPFPFDSVRTEFWPHWVYGRRRPAQVAAIALARRWECWPYAARGWNDRRVIAAVREFCDRHDALLVTKSRQKNPVRRYVRALSDRVLYDDAHYPATILDLLVAADLCVHFYSSALSEAVYAGTPSICVSPTSEEWPVYGRRMVVPEFSDAPESFYNFPGVTWRLRVPEFIERFGRASLAEFTLDPARRRLFIEKFLGFADVNVAARILADVRRRFVV